FDLLTDIFAEAAKKQEYDRFNGLLDTLKQRLPDVYAENKSYNLDWWISNALALGQDDVVRTKMEELSEVAGKDIDVFGWSVDRLSYHGHVKILIDAMRIAWPKVENSQNIMDWAIDDFSINSLDFEIFNLLDQSNNTEINDKILKDRIGSYINFEDNKEIINKTIEFLSGQAEHQWKIDDFSDLKDSKESKTSLVLLSREFCGELHRGKGIPLTKVELGRNELVQYFVKRVDGELVQKRSMMDMVFNPNKPEPKKPRPPLHLLCPDRETLDRFLAKSLDSFNPQIYKAVACFELVPDWLQFLISRELLDEKTCEKVLSNLRPMIADIQKISSGYHVDPYLGQAIREF
ncbi:MAG: hypothetical protein HQL69_24435, partial [Magnetococcales bacterium]|nr:hypothetical protein [Magnetococcales bacterium]